MFMIGVVAEATVIWICVVGVILAAWVVSVAVAVGVAAVVAALASSVVVTDTADVRAEAVPVAVLVKDGVYTPLPVRNGST